MDLIKHISIYIYLLLISCYSLEFQEKDIIPNQWRGHKIRVAKLGENYKKQIRHHRVFTKFSSDKSIPYYKFIGNEYEIVGFYELNKQNYLVIEDKKKRIFKFPCKKNSLPSFVFFVETLENAKNLIGNDIWLNNVFDQENFLTNYPKNFIPFQNVNVKEIISFQNSNAGHPIWLKVVTENGKDAIVRYNLQGRRVDTKDNYFKTDPLPKNWGYDVNEKIKNRMADIGMTTRQVQIAIGYPSKIINTSSRHGVSEQWMYPLKNKKIYYQFEYDTLIYINN